VEPSPSLPSVDEPLVEAERELEEREGVERAPTRLVAERIAEAPREPWSPPAAIAADASAPPEPPGVAEALVEATALTGLEPLEPPEPLLDDVIEPPPEVEPPPVEPRAPPLEKVRLSRPNPLRLPRNCGDRRAAAFAAAVVPVSRIER
jgi:hypothetical protein